MAKKKKKQLDIAKEFENAVYVPLETRQQIEEERKKQREQQSRLFDGGSGSIGTKIKNTAADVSLNILKGGLGATEGVSDFMRRRGASVLDRLGWDDKAEQLRNTANQNTTEGIASDFEHILYGDLSGSKKDEDIDVYEKMHEKSALTDRSRGIAQSVGYSVTNAAMSTAMGGGNVGSLLLTGVSAGGSAESRAIEQGMDEDDAFIYGVLSGSGEAVSEAFFGGVGKFTKALGYGKGALDDVLIENVTKRIGSNVLRSLTSFGLRAGGEGFEEILSAAFDTAAQKISGMDERSLAEIWQDQNVGQAFVDGVLSSMFSSSPRLVSSIATGTNYDNGTTRNEQRVIEDIIDQRTQGQKLSNKERGDLRQQITKDLIDGKIAGSEIDRALQNTETTWNQNKDRYITRTIVNENTKFTTTDNDLKIDKKQLNKNANIEDVQNKIKVLEQDFLNANNDIRNTTSSHELFDEMKRMIVATGEQQRLTSNKQMAEDGALRLLTNKKGEPIRNGRGELQYVKADTGQLVTINGYHTKDGMVLNADTHQAFESTMGHELGESLKANTPEIYKQLRDLAVEVGRADGTLTKETFDAIKSTYGELGTNTDNYLDEYVNDKIGEMFKSDSAMFQEIGKKPNVARRLLNEIKYLIQKFTAGSPEQKRLLEAQHNLKKALQESVRNLDVSQETTQQEIQQKTDNIQQEDIAPVKEQVKETPKQEIKKEKNDSIIPTKTDVDNVQNVKKIKEKYDASNKESGNKKTIVLSDGQKLTGVYKLVESGTVTPSHDSNNFTKSINFPTTEEGTTINDRDYENDKNAQQLVKDKAQNYDGRAFNDNGVIVTKDGIVVSGNDRTMAGEIAARNNTDQAYIDYLKENANQFGFTEEQINSMQHPRVVLELENNLNYDTNTFAKFNKDSKKSKSISEKAKEIRKTVDQDTIQKISDVLNDYEKIDDVYNSTKASKQLLDLMVNKNIIDTNDIAELYDGSKFTGAGKDLVEATVLGSVVSEDNLKYFRNNNDLKFKLMKSAPAIIQNKTLGDYSILDEINKAIETYKLAQQSDMTVEQLNNQTSLFGDSDFDLITKRIAETLETKGFRNFLNFIEKYNYEAQAPANGQVDIFSGEIPNKESVLKNALNIDENTPLVRYSLTNNQDEKINSLLLTNSDVYDMVDSSTLRENGLTVEDLTSRGLDDVDKLEDAWRKANYENSSKNFHEVPIEEAVSTIRNNNVFWRLSEGWFRGADSAYKPNIEKVIIMNPELRNAGMNIAYQNYKDYIDNNISFEDFINKEMSLYRGSNDGGFVDADKFIAFSYRKDMVEKHFANRNKETPISEIKVKIKDTLGSYQTTGEAEVLVPRSIVDENNIRYSLSQDNQGNEELTLYHGTSLNAAFKIQKYGFVSNSAIGADGGAANYNYFTNSRINAETYRDRKDRYSGQLLRVKKTADMQIDDRITGHKKGEYDFRTQRNVTPDEIQILTEDGYWTPISNYDLYTDTPAEQKVIDKSLLYDDDGNKVSDVKYSLTDNQGRELTQEQQEYFKDETTYSIKESKQMLEKQFKELTGDSKLVADAKIGRYALQQMQGNEVEAPYSKEAMELYKKIENSRKTSSHLYHSTPADRIQSIVQNGLQVGSQQNQEGVSSTDKLYLSATEELADSFTPEGSIMLRISPNANLENLDNDLLGGEGSYTITNNIDPKYLQVKENGKWVNLLKSQYAKQTKYSLTDNPKIFNEVKKYDSMEDFMFDSNISYDELESAGLGGLGEIVEYYNNKNKPILKDYKNTKESASFTEDRLDSVISESISDYDDNYARAYITHMSPEQFLGLTASEQTMERLNQETEELDVEKLAKERQHIFLDVDLETGKVTGHEGRHRMLALQRAGIKDVEMVIYPDSGTYDRSNAPRIDSMNLIGQDFRIGKGTDTTIGEMIPVSKATQNELRSQNRKDSGIRYSLSVSEANTGKDNQGRTLSKGMQDYMADSKVTDENGNLIETYHGTNNPGFNIFKPSQGNSQFGKYKFKDYEISYHTASLDTARGYTDIGVEEISPENGMSNIYRDYLNITNPFVVENSSTSDIKSWKNIKDNNIRQFETEYYDEFENKWNTDRKITENLDSINEDLFPFNCELRLNDGYYELYDLGRNDGMGESLLLYVGENDNTSELFYEGLKESVYGENFDDYIYSSDNIVKWVLTQNQKGADYDGIIIPDIMDTGIRGNMFGEPTTDYITFYSNQVKSVDNQNPTSNPDRRYSLSQKVDSELDPLTDEQYEYFKNTKAVDQDGELELVHHGTPHEFNIFDIEKAGETGLMFGNGFYFTTSQGRAEAFTGDNENGLKSGYVNIEKPASRDTKTMTFDEFRNLYEALNNNPNMFDEEMGMSNIDALLSDYGDIYNDKEGTIRSFFESYDNDVNLIDGLSYIGNPTEMYKVLRDTTGFDGIIVENPSEFSSGEKWYIAFNPDQFKLKDNKTPTDNVDMRLSLSSPDDIAPFGEGIKSEQIKPRDIQQTIQNSVQEAIAPIREQIQQVADEVIKSENLDDIELNLEPFMDMINGDNGQVLSNINKNYDQIMTNLQEQGLPKDAAQSFLQNMVHKYDQAFNKVKQKMSEKDRNKVQKMILDAQEKFTNRNAYVDKLAKDSGNETIKYKGDLANNSFGQAQYNVQIAQTDLNGNEIGKGIDGLFEQAEKQGLGAVLDDYLFHKSNIERHAVGKGSQVPASVSEQLIMDYEKSYPQLKEWSKGFEKYFDNLLQLEVDSGLIDQDTYNLLRGEEGIYRSYVPFFENEAEKRYYDDAGDLKPIKPLKRAKGGVNQSKLMGMKQAMTKQTMAVWQSMRTNQLYQEIINTLGGEEGLGFIVRNDPSNLSQSLYTDQDGNKFLTAYVNGQEMSTKISDELYNELSKKSENAIKEFEDRYSLLTKPLQGLSKFRRNVLTSYNPIFALYKNPVKDIQDAVLYSKHTAQMLKELPSSYGQLLTNKTKEAQQFRALYGGGEYSGFGKGYARVADMIELAPRFAEFKASLKAGDSVEQALYNARDITTNFGRGGYVTKAMNRNGFTFLNASVQGFSKFYRNFAEQPNAGQFAMAVGKAAMLGVVPAVFNELAFGGGDDKDEDYEAQPDYIKDNYYLFKKGDGEFIRIPKGRALSVIGSAARRTLERIEGEEDAFDGYLKNAWSQIGPVEISGNPLDNTIIAPIAQVLGGEKGSGGNTAGRAWYGGDIVPYRLQGEKPEDQSDASVDKMSIWLGEKFGISPYKINYVIDQYTGGLGDVILPMLTEETKSGAETLGEYAIAPIKDQIVVNSIDDNKYASEFYSTKEKLYTGSKATDKDLLKAQYMNDVSYDLSALYKEKRAIQSDSSLGKKEKYAKVQEIQKQINDIAKAGLELSDKITVQGNYADVGEDRGYYKNTKGKWTAISQDDMVTIESLGLTDSEKSAYFDVKNQIYNLDNDYKAKKEGKSESEQIQLGIQQKKDRIETIKSSTLPDSAKYAAFDTKYDDKLLPYYEDLGFNANDYLTYKQQTFTADKDKNGNSITNSKKKKIVEYINNTNMPYEQKLILYKKEYKSDNTYDSTIFNYINNSNLDYTSKTKILDELGIKYR